MIFDILFIRHGQSCANIWSKISVQKKISYKDPELTKSGIESSVRLGKILQTVVADIWPNKPFAIGSSQMIRAQETAYYMIARDTAIPIHILPHVAEKGISYDNYSLPKHLQYDILQQRTPDIISSLEAGMDAREKQTAFGKSNWNLFITWAMNHPEFFEQGDDGVYRAVIFTHSKFLQSTFQLATKIINNNGIRTIVDTNTLRKYPTHTRIDIGEINPSSCPDNCVRSPCAESITRVNTRLKIHTRKNNFYSNLELNNVPKRFRGDTPKNITNQYKSIKMGGRTKTKTRKLRHRRSV